MIDGIFGQMRVDATTKLATNDEETLVEVTGNVGVDFGEEMFLLNKPLVETRGVTVAENVADHIVGVVEGRPSVAHVPSHIEGIVGDVADNLFAARGGLFGLGRILALRDGEKHRGGGGENGAK